MSGSVWVRVGCLLAICWSLPAEALDYRVTDPALKVELLDSSETDSFLAVRVDAAGRIFVGGRKTLFVYEPLPDGTYKPRELLLEFPDHTWVYDIEIRGDDLYLMTVSALYIVPGGRIQRTGLKPQRLVWGVPNGHVHQCLHACAWGPEGDLYFSMGDPLWYYGDFSRPDHWGYWSMFFRPDENHPAGANGFARVPYHGVGAVFRVQPDGTKLRSFARGLRNSCGLNFDRNWNLFTNDNDHEAMPAFYAPGRLLQVSPQAYYSWPRGWLLSKTPDRADLLPTLNESLGRFVPVLQTYYADKFLPETYDNNLLVARWGRRTVSRFPLEKKDSSFTAAEHVMLEGQNQARPVGVCVGRGGRVFVTLSYMSQNEGSPVYRSDLAIITRADDSKAMPFDGYEPPTATADKLWSELASPSWSQRSVAHQELLRRGGPLLLEAARKLKNAVATDPATPHLLWLAAASAKASKTDYAGQILRKLANGENANLRLQAVRALDHFPELHTGRDFFVSKFDDADPQVQVAAVTGLFSRIGEEEVPYEVLELPARSKDAFVRHTTAILLSQLAPFDQIAQLVNSRDAQSRMTGVLAAGFAMTVPGVHDELPEQAPLEPQRTEAANIIEFADGKVDLREQGRLGNYTMAEYWKSAPRPGETEMFFALLMERLADPNDQIRLQAAHFLSVVNDPRSEPEIAKVLTDVQDRRLSLAGGRGVAKVWMLGPLPDGDKGFETAHAPELGPVDLRAKVEAGGMSLEWKEVAQTGKDRPLYDFAQLFGPSPQSSVYSLFRIESSVAQRCQLLLGAEDGLKVWHNGKLVWSKDDVRPNIQYDDVVTIDLQPGGNDILLRDRMRAGLGGQYIHYRTLQDVQITLPPLPDGLSLAERLKAAGTGNQPIDPKFLEVDWAMALKGADVERGRKLFGAESLGCAKCHAATPVAGTTGGPSLADAGRRFELAYLVESVLAPNKVISPVFKSTALTTVDGKVLTGLVVMETADKLELLLPDTKRVTLAKSEIEDRKASEVSAMPAGVVKTPEELRDVLAYLLSNPMQ
ncbi:hypothetical protein [Planctellipticum variicoloris]|uniref:hypothetical protein n=1 Tax=Planctellipticum variicoloris TaxID=3064265 RepID=UPI003013C32B|nr:c-type cytochrome [Planctomycetaceae bacterium SH412]